MDLGTPSMVTTIPLLQYKPGDLGLVPAARPSISPTVLQKLGKVRIPVYCARQSIFILLDSWKVSNRISSNSC